METKPKITPLPLLSSFSLFVLGFSYHAQFTDAAD